MRRITRRTLSKYMKVLVDLSLKSNSRLIRLRGEPMDALMRRADFGSVLQLLFATGYLTPGKGDVFPTPAVYLTDKGLTYFIDEHTRFMENLWTRCLAIAALAVSIASVLVSVLLATR